jgi:hypothetical protein
LAFAPVQTKLGRSAVKATSIAGIFAMVRMHPATARKNGWFGACTFEGGFLLLEVIPYCQSFVTPLLPDSTATLFRAALAKVAKQDDPETVLPFSR